jgi:HK97 gp10 family phage protein
MARARVTRVTVDQSAIDRLGVDRAVLAAVDEEVATPLAKRMAEAAPKDTGAGAASIASVEDPDEPGFRVGWSPEHFYLGFHELGTAHQPARPFARPAADEFGAS